MFKQKILIDVTEVLIAGSLLLNFYNRLKIWTPWRSQNEFISTVDYIYFVELTQKSVYSLV